MKILIIGDLHFGFGSNQGKQHPTLNINTRLLDYDKTLHITIDEAVEAGATYLVFTGDVFESRRPTLTEQKLFSKALRYALSQGIEQIYIVIGNHDQQRLSQTTTLSYLKELKLDNIHVCDEIELFELPDVNLILMPYRDRKWFGVEGAQEAIDLIRSDLTYQLRSIHNDKPKLLVGHMAVEGTFFDDNYLDMYDANQLFLPKDMFEGIDYTLMGHIHEPGVLCEEPYIAYVGSMEKQGSFETHDKVYAIYDTRNNSISFHKEPCRELYDVELDLTKAIHGDGLMDRVFAGIDRFAENHNLPSSIVGLSLRISAEDEKYCDTKSIINYLKENHKVNYCLNIKPHVFTPRQARDARINEQTSDPEALRLFLENTTDEKDLREDLYQAGVEVIKIVEAERAAD